MGISVSIYIPEMWQYYVKYGKQINPLSTKLYLSDLKTQLVPPSKHSLLRF